MNEAQSIFVIRSTLEAWSARAQGCYWLWRLQRFLQAVIKVQRFIKTCHSTMKSLTLAVFKGWLQWEGQVLLLRQTQLREWARGCPSAGTTLTKESIWTDFLPFLIPRSLKLECCKEFCAEHLTQLSFHHRRELRKDICGGCVPYSFVRALHEKAVHRDHAIWIQCLQLDGAEVQASLRRLLRGVPRSLWEQAVKEWRVQLSVELELFHNNPSANLPDLEERVYPYSLVDTFSFSHSEQVEDTSGTSDESNEEHRDSKHGPAGGSDSSATANPPAHTTEVGWAQSDLEDNYDFSEGTESCDDGDKDSTIFFTVSPPSPHFHVHQPARRAVAMELMKQQGGAPQESYVPRIPGRVDLAQESSEYRRVSREIIISVPDEPVVRHATLEELQEAYAQKWRLNVLTRRAIRWNRLPPRSNLQTLRQEDKKMKPFTARKYAAALGSHLPRAPRPLDADFTAPTYSSSKKKALPVDFRPAIRQHDERGGIPSSKGSKTNLTRKVSQLPSPERGGLHQLPNECSARCSWSASDSAKEAAWRQAVSGLCQLAPIDVPVHHSTDFERKFATRFAKLSALVTS